MLLFVSLFLITALKRACIADSTDHHEIGQLLVDNDDEQVLGAVTPESQPSVSVTTNYHQESNRGSPLIYESVVSNPNAIRII
jgi:hypothetical protein